MLFTQTYVWGPYQSIKPWHCQIDYSHVNLMCVKNKSCLPWNSIDHFIIKHPWVFYFLVSVCILFCLSYYLSLFFFIKIYGFIINNWMMIMDYLVILTVFIFFLQTLSTPYFLPMPNKHVPLWLQCIFIFNIVYRSHSYHPRQQSELSWVWHGLNSNSSSISKELAVKLILLSFSQILQYLDLILI